MQYDQGDSSFPCDLLTLFFGKCGFSSQTASFMNIGLLSATPEVTSLFVTRLGHVPIFGSITAILKMPCTNWLDSGLLTHH